LGVKLPDNAGEDSFSLMPLLKGEDKPIRENAVSASIQGTPAVRSGSWKYIPAPGSGGWGNGGDQSQPVQLYNLADDLGETKNLAAAMPEKVTEMKGLLEKLITDGRSTLGAPQKNDVEVVRYPNDGKKPNPQPQVKRSEERKAPTKEPAEAKPKASAASTPAKQAEAWALSDILRDRRFMHHRADRDGDGQMSRDEYVGRDKPEVMARKTKEFAEWDKNNDGLLTQEEYSVVDERQVRGKASNLKGLNQPGKEFIYKQSDGQPREIEVFFPPNHDPAKSKVPGVILFHGGGWYIGDMAGYRPMCNYLASRGLVTATANYRMLTERERKAPKNDNAANAENGKRVCVIDAKTAIRWFKAHAAEFGIDANRIITGGSSAGGHIALLATTNPGLNDPNDPQELRAIDTGVVAYLLENPAFQDSDREDPEIDIFKHARQGMAPAWVTFGSEDGWRAGWDPVYPQLKSLGQSIESWLAEGQGHSFFGKDPKWGTVTQISADRFLVKHGFLKGESPLKAPESGEKLIFETEK
jgi:acetyl esterase/lipase